MESLQKTRWHIAMCETSHSIFHVYYSPFHKLSAHVFSFKFGPFVTFLRLFEIERFETTHRGPSQKAQNDVIFSDLPCQISAVLRQL